MESILPPKLFSIGHSNQSLASLIALLRLHGIALLADVRSNPASRYLPHFNRAPLQVALQQGGIGYRWLGQGLGGKPQDAALYSGGRPDYACITASAAFQGAIAALLDLAAVQPVAIMCAERDPAQCHRAHLVTPALLAAGAEMLHILGDGSLEADASLRRRMQQTTRRGGDPRQADLFA